jgi:hypothetical protein
VGLRNAAFVPKEKPAPNYEAAPAKSAGGKPATGRLCQAGMEKKRSEYPANSPHDNGIPRQMFPRNSRNAVELAFRFGARLPSKAIAASSSAVRPRSRRERYFPRRASAGLQHRYHRPQNGVRVPFEIEIPQQGCNIHPYLAGLYLSPLNTVSSASVTARLPPKCCVPDPKREQLSLAREIPSIWPPAQRPNSALTGV